ncbi:helix-turn-helix domain-containing protein [Candidatus Micrarchaeota archaeon]|nr:helix-turn-helix domain-containing protein [Candidatus Micrarchaeota archaeon]
MYESTLQELGLSSNESKIYECLLSLGSCSIEQIAIKSKVHRRNIYDVLAKLLEKGLISESFIHNRKEYKAINPTRLLDLIQEKERRLTLILPDLYQNN